MEYVLVDRKVFGLTEAFANQFIDVGCQGRNITSVVLIDLTALYGTVWSQGLIHKFPKNHKSKTIASSLTTYSATVPFVPIGLPESRSRKFCYADDMALCFSHRIFDETEIALNEDLITMNDCLMGWRLNPVSSKIETSCFHLNHKISDVELNVHPNATRLINLFSKCPNVVLDRTLPIKKNTYFMQLQNSKIETVQNNADTQLRKSMQINSGAIEFTSTPNMAPHMEQHPTTPSPKIKSLGREIDKIQRNLPLKIHDNFAHLSR